jgi:hypothetical protein
VTGEGEQVPWLLAQQERDNRANKEPDQHSERFQRAGAEVGAPGWNFSTIPIFPGTRAGQEAPSIVHEALRSFGNPLDGGIRAFFDSRFGHDFSRVRVHTDAVAAESANQVRAQAFTVGDHIMFGKGQFAPATEEGRRLLAHELAHVVQQSGSANEAALKIGDPTDTMEQEADNAARAVRVTGATREESMASRQSLALGSRPAPHRMVQRDPVKTWAGEFEAPEKDYKETYERDPRAQQVRPGVEIHIIFRPYPVVNAEEIAFVQTATTFLNGQPYAIKPTVAGRMIPFPEPGAGTHIDVGASAQSPFLGQQLGAQVEMTDDPGFLMGEKDEASMIFETAAVAVKGAQKGAYYGAAKWGWTRQPSQPPKKLEFGAAGLVPGGPDFLEAARLFDVSTTSQGQKTIHLPTVQVVYTTKKTKLVADPGKPGARGTVELEANTRLEVTEETDPAHKGWQHVIVVGGRYAGKPGWVNEPLSDSPSLIITPKKSSRP